MTSESSDGLRSPWLTRRELLESRTHPLDWLFVGLVGQWIFINFVLYPPYGRFLVQAGSLQRQMGPIFPVTYGCAIGIVLYGLYIFRRRYGLDVVRSGVYSIGLGLAATSLFEILWQNVGSGTGVGNQGIWTQIINLSAIALAFCSIRYWRSERVVLLFIIAYLTGWIVWVSIGYPQWYDPDPTRSLIAYAFNGGLKAASFVLMALLVSFAPKTAGSRDRSGRTPLASGTGL